MFIIIINFSLHYNMGNDIQKKICCLENRKHNDEDYLYYSNKSDNILKKDMKKLNTSKNINLIFSSAYSLSTISYIIIVVNTAAPPTLLVSAVFGSGIFFYYLYSFREDLKTINMIASIFLNRKIQNIEIKDNIFVFEK